MSGGSDTGGLEPLVIDSECLVCGRSGLKDSYRHVLLEHRDRVLERLAALSKDSGADELERANERNSKTAGKDPSKETFPQTEKGKARDKAAENTSGNISEKSDGDTSCEDSQESNLKQGDEKPDVHNCTYREKGKGQRLDPVDPRECDACGMRVSVGFARVFGAPDGSLTCRACASRSVRYTNDPVRGEDADYTRGNGSTLLYTSSVTRDSNEHGKSP